MCIREEEGPHASGRDVWRCGCTICRICLLPPPSILYPPSILKEKGKHKNCFHRAQHLRQVHFLQFSWWRSAFTLVYSWSCHRKENNTEGRRVLISTLEIEGKCVLNEKEECRPIFMVLEEKVQWWGPLTFLKCLLWMKRKKMSQAFSRTEPGDGVTDNYKWVVISKECLIAKKPSLLKCLKCLYHSWNVIIFWNWTFCISLSSLSTDLCSALLICCLGFCLNKLWSA